MIHTQISAKHHTIEMVLSKKQSTPTKNHAKQPRRIGIVGKKARGV
jgi:hypothetical protein